MLTCRDVTALSVDAAEGRLSLGQRLAYWMHLALCAACRRYRAQMDRPASPEMPAVVREEFERLRKERSQC
jgi:anti-sigma factor ChrR (cupin superfamily)